MHFAFQFTILESKTTLLKAGGECEEGGVK